MRNTLEQNGFFSFLYGGSTSLKGGDMLKYPYQGTKVYVKGYACYVSGTSNADYARNICYTERMVGGSPTQSYVQGLGKIARAMSGMGGNTYDVVFDDGFVGVGIRENNIVDQNSDKYWHRY